MGVWAGKLVTYKSEIPLKLAFFDSGDVHAQLGAGQPPVLFNRPEWRNGAISGEILGDVGRRTPIAVRIPLDSLSSCAGMSSTVQHPPSASLAVASAMS